MIDDRQETIHLENTSMKRFKIYHIGTHCAYLINQATFAGGLKQTTHKTRRYSKWSSTEETILLIVTILEPFETFFPVEQKNAGIDNARPSKRRTNYRIFLPLSREDRAINDGPRAHFADEILRRFSLFTVDRPFAAIFERARRTNAFR